MQFLKASSSDLPPQQDTPTLVITRKSDWTTTANKQLQKFSLASGTPVPAAPTQPAIAATTADTCSSAALGLSQSSATDQAEDDDFRLTFSHTYVRDQDDEGDTSPTLQPFTSIFSPRGSPLYLGERRRAAGVVAPEGSAPAAPDARGSTNELRVLISRKMPAAATQQQQHLSAAENDVRSSSHIDQDASPCYLDQGRAPSFSDRFAALEAADSLRRVVTPELCGGQQQPASTSSTPALTPDLACNNQRCGAQPTSSSYSHVFNIFKPTSERRFVSLIRHGESEYNKAVTEGNSFKDPMIFDPRLTSLGHTQVSSLCERVSEMLHKHGSQPLWVVSPLTRCLETFSGVVSGLSEALRPKANQIVISSTIAEFLVTAGDVGRPTSELQRCFPQLSEQLAMLPEIWWHSGPSQPNCALRGLLLSHEPKAQQQRRLADFTRWLNARPERFVICVGHCSFWYQFLGKARAKRLANCEMHSMYW